MKSKWYENELNQFKEARLKSKKGTSKSLIGLTVFFAALMVIIFVVYTKNPDYAIGPSAGIVGGMYVFILLMMLLSQKKANKITENPTLDNLEEQLERLLTTEELVAEFDAEMFAGPVRYIVNESTDQIYLTPHYLIEKAFVMGKPMYVVVRLDQVGSIDYCGTKDHVKVNPLARLYDIDILDQNGGRLGGLTVHGTKTLKDLKDALNVE